MDELKNLMIQTMESNGILGQLRAQIRCSVFKIIDSQDEMENPKQKARSALHWENQKARELLTENGAIGLLVAELIREYLDFYKLDYTKQIFMPETNLMSKQQSTKQELHEQSGLNRHLKNQVSDSQPILVQILEKFVNMENSSNSPAPAAKEKSNANSNYQQNISQKQNKNGSKSQYKNSDNGGLDFSEDKNQKSSDGGFNFGGFNVGDGILQQQKSISKNEIEQSRSTNKNLEKATNLLDEISKEEKSGYKAEINKGKVLHQEVDSSSKSIDKNKGKENRENLSKKSSQDLDDNYEDQFEEIDEELPEQENEIDVSGDRIAGVRGMGESHGITVSQSLGIDPSVDSLQLEEYDHIEEVDKVQYR